MKISRRNIITTSIALGSSTVLPTAKAQANDTLKIAFAARGNATLDPIKSIQGADSWSLIHIHDTLIDSPYGRFAEKPEDFQPRLALSWTMSTDAKVWTFKLRQGVQFHKGYGEMTSEDVVFSLDRARDPKGGSTKSIFEGISNVRADGKYGVVITLKQADPLFLGGTLTDYTALIMSKKAILEKGENIKKDPIGTGAYQFVSLDPDPSKGVFLTANPNYFMGAPKTKNLQILYLLDTTARTLALLSGNVHMIEGVRAPGWTKSIQQKNPQMLFDVAAPGSLFTMHFNLSRKPLNDVRVRRAFAHAIDRDLLVKAMDPISKRTYGLHAPSFPGGLIESSLPPNLQYKYDPEKAKALLTEAGFPNGFTIDASTSQREDYKALMLIVQDQMRKVGVTINLQTIDHTTFHANNRKDQNSLPQNSSAYPPVPSVPIIENAAKVSEVKSDGTGGTNYSHYGSLIPGIDDLLDQGNKEANYSKRIEIFQRIEKKILEDLPLLAISTNGYLIVRDPKVKLGYEVKSGYAYWRLELAVIS